MVNTDDNRSLKHALLTVLIASLCVGAAVAIVEILGGNAFDDTAARVVGTAVALTFYSLAGLAATRLGHRREELGGLAALELVAYAWGFIAALAALWVAAEHEWLWRTAAIALVVTLGSAHGSLFLAARSAGESAASTFVRRATIAAG